MSLAYQPQTYPYIECDPEIAGGTPIITGTRITVRCIAGYYQMGMTVDEILNTLAHLTPAQVHSALAYYFDHQKEVDTDLTCASDIDYWKSQVKSSSRPASPVT